MSSAPPKFITGGCLCGAIRYRADFPPDHDFKKMSSVCMCTQCRKQTGSLAIHFHVVPLTSFNWLQPRSSDTTDTTTTNLALIPHDPSNLPSALGDYQATPNNHRYFCTVCGGLTVWFGPTMGHPSTPSASEMEICCGSIDEAFLIGQKDASCEVLPDTGFGKWLCDPEARVVWAQNEIVGVTEGIGCSREGGERWKFGTERGVRAGE